MLFRSHCVPTVIAESGMAKNGWVPVDSANLKTRFPGVYAIDDVTSVGATKTGVFAYSTICTHQGCTVAYEPAKKILKCPCHLAEFDPFKSAKPVVGPAINPLRKVKVAISGAWVILT